MFNFPSVAIETYASIVSKLGFIPANSSNTPTISSGVVAPSSVPSKIGDIYIDTANIKFYRANGTSSSSDWVLLNGAYTLTLSSGGTFNPVDDTTYYAGFCPVRPMLINNNHVRIYIPRSGTITKIYFNLTSIATVASNEASSIYLKVNHPLEYLISNNIKLDSYDQYISNTSLNIPVVAGDHISLRWTTPTWATKPTSVILNGNILIEL